MLADDIRGAIRGTIGVSLIGANLLGGDEFWLTWLRSAYRGIMCE